MSKEIIPFKCPVCNGTGRVKSGFYQIEGLRDRPFNINTYGQGEECKTCKGTGIIWRDINDN